MEKFQTSDIPKSPRIQKLVDALYEHMPVIESARAKLITESTLDLSESDGAQDFVITVNGTASKKLTIEAGDKVEFKYWPRIQASSGNSGYTRAFCTWKMAAKKDSVTGKITLE